MSTTIVAVGMGLAAAGIAVRYAARYMPQVTRQAEQAFKTGKLPMSEFSNYYKGGFDSKMTKREAGLILGVSPSANQKRIKEAHKRIMIANHPDKGGSPYVAAKINEAKDCLEASPNRK